MYKKYYSGWNVNDYLEVVFIIKYKPIDYGYCKSFLKEAKHKFIIIHPLGKKGKLPIIILGRNNIPGFLTLHASNNKVFWHTETNKIVKVLNFFFFFFPVLLFKNNSTTLLMSVSYFSLIQGHTHYIPLYTHYMGIAVRQANMQVLKKARLNQPSRNFK